MSTEDPTTPLSDRELLEQIADRLSRVEAELKTINRQIEVMTIGMIYVRSEHRGHQARLEELERPKQ